VALATAKPSVFQGFCSMCHFLLATDLATLQNEISGLFFSSFFHAELMAIPL
jgi:hypothetical protein